MHGWNRITTFILFVAVFLLPCPPVFSMKTVINVAAQAVNTKSSEMLLKGFSSQYQLIDFGDGKRLERFGPYVVCRPCPVATTRRKLPARQWDAADISYHASGQQTRGEWVYRDSVLRNGSSVLDWTMTHPNGATFVLNTYEHGQVGVFPEQEPTWKWIGSKLSKQVAATTKPKVKLLNAFAYTGGSTLACLVDPRIQV